MESDSQEHEAEKAEAGEINIDDYLTDDDIPNYKTQSNNHSSDDEERHVPYAAGQTFHQSLQEQLNTFTLSDEDASIAEFLLGSVDNSGYIRRSLLDLVDDLAFTQNIFVTEEKGVILGVTCVGCPESFSPVPPAAFCTVLIADCAATK